MRDKRIVHVDIDEHVFNTKHRAEIRIHASVVDFLNSALTKEKLPIAGSFATWVSVVHKWKERYGSFDNVTTALKANNVTRRISQMIAANIDVSMDVGLNQMCVAQSFVFSGSRRAFTSAGHGSMGYSLPAAIGLAYAAKCKTPVIAFMGDGGMQMNIQELQTICRDDLPVKIIILNNSCLGMIRDYQSRAFESRFYGSVEGYSTPSFAKIAEAYGIRYFLIGKAEDIDLLDAFVLDNLSVIIEVALERDMNTIPQIGTNAFEQIPLLTSKENVEIGCDLSEIV